MTDRYAKLRECLLKAAPSPWTVEEFNTLGPHGEEVVESCDIVIAADGETIVADHCGKNTAAYIAAASPATIRALLAERDALERINFAAGGLVLQVESLLALGPSHDGAVERDLMHLVRVFYRLRAALSAGAREEET